MALTEPLGHLSVGEHRRRLVHPECDARFEEGGIDVLSAAGALPGGKGGEDADSRVHPSTEIGDRNRNAVRGAVRGAVDAHEAGHPARDEVEPPARGVGAGLAEARDGAVDEPRVDGAHRVVADADPGRGSRLEVLDQHVSGGREPLEEGEVLGVLEVEGDGALVAVPEHERRALALDERRGAPHVVAGGGPLDLDHVRAVVGQDHRAPGAGQVGREVEHPDV